MDITEVNLKLAQPQPPLDGLVAYVNLVLDNTLAIKDVRLIRIRQRYIVCMPSKDKTDRCPNCDAKNSLFHRFCHSCGDERQRSNSPSPLDSGRIDQVHPINSSFRNILVDRIVQEYQKERGSYRE
jgi:DNA-binding cell septation regulator SpoVG